MSTLLLAACSASAQSPPQARFSGSGVLQAAIPASADGRFALNAELHGAPTVTTSARFAIDAHLEQTGKDKALNTACGPAVANIFNDGFEN
ncbi:MAG: hypothetical protein SGI99_14550 [Pseudomonadota bacterium]|nr:hypothetical protein [Pseudomonadota bacterium]